jgi:hypothetical protein
LRAVIIAAGAPLGSNLCSATGAGCGRLAAGLVTREVAENVDAAE